MLRRRLRRGQSKYKKSRYSRRYFANAFETFSKTCSFKQYANFIYRSGSSCKLLPALKCLTCFVVGLIISLFFTSELNAQTNPGGIIVSPSIINLDLADDPPEYKLTYENKTDSSVVLKFRAQDFTELEEGWKVNFLEPKIAQNYRYSLSSWINFNKTSLTLGSNEKGEVMVSIDEEELSPGAHYASILAEIEQEDNSDNTGVKNLLPLHGILSSLVFVRTHKGNEIEEAEINGFKQNQEWFNFPYQFFFLFKNSGNVELIPYGILRIYDPFSRLVSKIVVNEGSFITLPETVRRYDLKTNTEAGVKNILPLHILIPGVYKAKLVVTYGKSKAEIKEELSFFTLGSINLIYLIIVFIGLTLLIFYLRRRILPRIRKKSLPTFH